MQFIVCKMYANGHLGAGTPPTIHQSYGIAVAEAERLAGMPENNAIAYVVFQAVARSERVACPVKTIDLR